LVSVKRKPGPNSNFIGNIGELLGPIGDLKLEFDLIQKTRFEIYQKHQTREELKEMAETDKDILFGNVYKHEHGNPPIISGSGALNYNVLV